MLNASFYKELDFWGWLIVLALSIRPALNVNLNSMDWMIQAVFAIVSIIGICRLLFFKRTAE
ncbi:hypothetical protein [Lactiplantibacillus pentosus]|uniref:Immunity protein n=2 Tax=Lactiplantibacillus pentosus TaxID=1589 RepID=A0AAW8VYA5_LACPE|nr:hypothetical protein [Lactiplantibacillus pentosus]AYG39221.1 hypothetical protein CFK27_15350 [Lactiplantibacillus pentosus]AYG41881.1 hypothetical protein CFI14_12505 [Lactiplantibacillus pentosus]AYJ40777.1 hypothetical protein LP314_02055 [Lactiplantibacillus pentosus]KRK25754.1 hypothetical protein FD24_GL002895 [Lactiplantibacillus pentosus DSM 20314]MBU7473783.1 hypothetical protein [Lactiplantibacillus pentosus]